jgi:hypothetical protein
MSPVEKIAAYLVAAEDVAAALDDVLDAIDPEGEEYGDAIAALNRFRHQQLELSGQTALQFPDVNVTATLEAAQWT